MKRTRSIVGCVRASAAVALSVGAAASWGQIAPAAPARVAAMPQDAWFALRVEGAASWRTHGPTQRLVAVLTELGALDKVKTAWSELAGTLGMEDGPAFDALLGRSVVFSMAGEGAWGILGSVTAESGRKLESKLDPAPRGFEDGRAVMLVERGKFRLTKLPAEGDADGVRMVLTPGEGAEPIALTTGAAAALAGPAGPVAVGAPVGTVLAGGRVASWYWRLDESGSSLSGTVIPEERGWGLSFRGTAQAAGMTPEACRVAAKAAGGEEAGGDGALLELASRVPGSMPGVRSQARALTAVLAAAKVKVPGPELMGDGVVIRLERAKGGAAGAAGVGVLVACEVRNRAEAAGALDAMIVGVLDLAWKLSAGAQAEPRMRDFRREIERAKDDPAAVRLVVLGGDKAAGAEAGGTLAWTCVGGGLGAGAEGSGWWVAQFTPGAGGRDEAERSLREAAGRVQARSWGSVVLTASVQPSEIWRTWELGGLGAEVAGLAAMKELERVELTVRASGDALTGSGRVVVTPAKKP